MQAGFDAGKLQLFGDQQALSDQAAFTAFTAFIKEQRKLSWIVYAKPPFASPEKMLAYLSGYTHRVAIANTRLVAMDQTRVRFRWRDYRRHNKARIMTLDAHEFIRRFLLHILPGRFHRIRHYGVDS